MSRSGLYRLRPRVSGASHVSRPVSEGATEQCETDTTDRLATSRYRVALIMSDSPSARVFLLDGSALAYRAHFAMARSNLSSPDGRSVGGVYGFASELQRLLERERPSHCAVVFDTSAPTFRHEMYDEYKATRQKMPEDLAEQLPLMKQVAELLGFVVLEKDGFEADDIIGTLAKQAETAGGEAFLVTGDKDFMQLVTDRVKLYNIMKKGEEVAIIGPGEVEEKFGVPPAQVVDVLGLMGDTSDNVPGVPGVGQKTAAKLVQTHGSVEKLLENPSADVSPRIRTKLAENDELARLSKRLVIIDTEVPIEVTIPDLEHTGPRAEEAAAFFEELGFRTLRAAMQALLEPEEEVDATPLDHAMITDAAALDALLEDLAAAPLAAVDTETTGLDALNVRIVGLSFSVREGHGRYVPLNLDPPVVAPTDADDPGSGVLAKLKPWLEDADAAKCGQNLKYDLQVLSNHGITLRGIHTDSMIASYLLEPHQRERNLDALALRHFGFRKIKTEELIGKGKDEKTFDQIPPEDVSPYACEDADYSLRLSSLFLDQMGEGALRKLHDDVEIPLIPVLARMERAGVRLDEQHLLAMTDDLDAEVQRLEKSIQELAGEEFKVNSPKQLGEILFEKLKIHEELKVKPKRTKTGWSTGQEVLESLAGHPLPGQVLAFRALTKLLNTYVRVLPELVDERTGRIHASFNQTVAATGRLSSSDPNLQNIPIRSEAGRKIREAFVPTGEDGRLFAADYSQVELRIMAHLSGDPGLTEAFREGRDIHADTAARIFGVAPQLVEPAMRSRAKAVNFGVLYGMGPQRLARENGLSLKEAKDFIKRYFEAFPAIRDFIAAMKEKVREDGYAETLLGRRRPIPEIHSSNRALAIQAENMAVNTPIQGSAADILKIAMVAIDRRLGASDLAARMILTVHDELVFDVPEGEVEELSALVVAEMSGAFALDVPLEVSTGVGLNWLEAH